MHFQLGQAAPACDQNSALWHVTPASMGCLPCSVVHAEVVALILRAGCNLREQDELLCSKPFLPTARHAADVNPVHLFV